MVTTVGSYNATATLGAPGNWIMQMVAFGTPASEQGAILPRRVRRGA